MNRKLVANRARGGLLAALLIAVAALAIGACGDDDDDSSGDSSSTAVRGAILPTATHLPMMVAEDEGIFEKNGIDMELTVVQNIATLPGAMGRQFDFGSTTLPDVIKAQQQGIDVVVTSNVADETEDNQTSGVFAGKGTGITTAADLEGKTVGVIALGGNIHTSTVFWMIEEGADPEAVNFVEVPPPNQVDQLAGGEIDAAENLEPFKTAMLEGGATEVVNPILEVSSPTATLLSWMSTREYAEDNAETVDKVVASINEAIEFIGENDTRARAILAEYSGLPPEVAESVQLQSYNTEIPDDQVLAWAEMLATIGELEGSPEDVSADEVLAIPE